MKTKLPQTLIIVLFVLLSIVLIRDSDPIASVIGGFFLLTLVIVPVLSAVTRLRGWELTGTAFFIASIIIFIFWFFVML